MKYKLGNIVEFNIHSVTHIPMGASIDDLCIGEIRSITEINTNYISHNGGRNSKRIYYEISGFERIEESRIINLISESRRTK